MPEQTKPTPFDLLPKYIIEGLQKQDSETLRAAAHNAQELQVYHVAQAEADRTAAADTYHIEQATANELAAKARVKEISEDVADWNAIVEKRCPDKNVDCGESH